MKLDATLRIAYHHGMDAEQRKATVAKLRRLAELQSLAAELDEHVELSDVLTPHLLNQIRV